jgi:hypothetical protein
VFTARYALSPYIKQIRFVFKGLNKPVSNKGKENDLLKRNYHIDANNERLTQHLFIEINSHLHVSATLSRPSAVYNRIKA